jgi:23S rRNA pseudouridine1911/1915/1917 synthase
MRSQTEFGNEVERGQKQTLEKGIGVAANPDDGRLLPAPSAEAPLLAWLLDVLRPMNRTRVKQFLRHGRVLVNGTITTRHDHVLQPGDAVLIAERRPMTSSLAQHRLHIVLEDEALIVLDKPPGLLTVATASERTNTAFAYLNAHLREQGRGRPFVVHRLDRETSGLLLFARSASIRDELQQAWKTVTKTYLAVVEGKPRLDSGIVDNFLVEGRDLRMRIARSSKSTQRAVTHYRVIATRGSYSLVQLVLETGRKHQIRVHLAGLGCPVIGDDVYGSTCDPAGRLGLHAWRLAFTHPLNGDQLELVSPLPRELGKLAGNL